MVRNRKKDVEMERPKDQASRSGVFSSPSAVSDAMPTTRDGVASWSCERVSQWLADNGFQRYSHLIAEEHGVDGYALLMLSESDLRQPPLQLTVLGDIKKLGHALNELRRTRHDRINSSPPPVDKCPPSLSLDSSTELSSDIRRHDNHCCQGHHTHSSPKPSPPIATHPTSSSDCEECRWQRHFHALRQHSAPDKTPTLLLANGLSTSNSYRVNREYIIRQVESPDSQAKMLFKTFIAFLYCLASLLITALVMVIVHDRVPDMKMYPPLPDIVLDNVPLIPWAFEVCELCALLMAFVWLMVLILHKHRTVIMRRMFSLVGTVFLLRCVTMLITSLSVPGIHLECSSKKYTSVWEKMAEAYRIWSHMGMSVQGVRSCGDYMFSGHTTAITLLNHFITEYTPETWHFLHTATWVLNLFGIFFILAGHEHYSIDVFIAFYITSRLFLYYHALAYNNSVSPMSHYDKRTRMWFPLSWFFESGGHGRVINEYELPVPDLHTIRDVVGGTVGWARTWWQARWQTEQLQPDTTGRQTPKRDKNKRTPR